LFGRNPEGVRGSAQSALIALPRSNSAAHPSGLRLNDTRDAATMHAVQIDHVTKTFGKHVAVNDLCLEVPEGAIYGFIGPNGSGKTTTLRMIMRILLPDSGTIHVLGESSTGAAHDEVGYLPEERGLYKQMKVREVLRFFASLKGMRSGDARKAIDVWLERFGLARWAGERVEALSKGMAQKVQFLTAIIARPRLVLLDEPFSGLDPVNAELLREAVLDLKRAGTTVIFSTHDMAVAEKLCDFIFMIYQGHKVLDGTLESIQARYGEDTLRIRMENNDASLDGLPGVAHRSDFGRYQELRIDHGVDPQQVLAALMARGKVLHFELTRPSLHEIFVRIASPIEEASSRNGKAQALTASVEA
jgi:ABC-2 type transport system ATP-binding protein